MPWDKVIIVNGLRLENMKYLPICFKTVSPLRDHVEDREDREGRKREKGREIGQRG